jgi:ADP-ribose pyrophosphatase YjhB (NUDIX family)
MIEHFIERNILRRLMLNETLHFSQLKAKDMESNLFMYHLNSLVRKGYISKTNDGYSLAPLGLHYVDSLSNVNLKPREQPKIITILAITNNHDQWLLAERQSQPYIHQLMFPSGKQHLGELMIDHAKREAEEKIGLKLSLKYRGLAEVAIFSDKILLSHIIGYVYFAKRNIKLPNASERFHYLWFNFSSDSDKLMPGTFRLYQELQKGKPNFLISLKYNLSSPT